MFIGGFNMGLKKIMLCFLLATSFSQVVYAESTSLSTIEKTEQDKQDVFIQSLNKTIEPNILHTAQTIKEWRIFDLNYLKEIKDIDYSKEINLLREEVEKMLMDYTLTSTNSKIYGFQTVEWIDTLVSAIDIREQLSDKGKAPRYTKDKAYIGLLKYNVLDKTNGKNTFESSMDSLLTSVLNKTYLEEQHISTSVPQKEDLEMFASELYNIFHTYSIPKELLSYLNIYVSPYYLDGFLGFAYSNALTGRDEEIVIAPALEGHGVEKINDVILHELGHIFYADTIGIPFGPTNTIYVRNPGIYNAFVSNFPEDVVPQNREERNYFLSESFAEHFRVLMQQANGIDAIEKDFVIYEDVLKFIESLLETYDPELQKAYPTIKLNDWTVLGKEFGVYPLEKIPAGKVSLMSDLTTIKDEQILYSLLKRDEKTNSAIHLIDKKPLTEMQVFDLEPGDYALLINAKDALIRFNDFRVD